MKKWSKGILAVALAIILVTPLSANAAGLQKQQGTKVLKGIEQNGVVYVLPESLQTVYSLVVDQMEMLPRLAAFDGAGHEVLSLDYRTNNVSVDMFVAIDAAGLQKKCSTYDFATGTTASHSSVYTYAANGLAVNQYDLLGAEENAVELDKKGRIISGCDHLFEFSYNASGKIEKTVVEGSVVNKLPGVTVIYSYEYDANGDVATITEVEQYINGEQVTVGVTRFLY